jgi:antitoxin (DNA-binding transcriptional repressor) of toxin-antitoxin stability system
MYRRGVMAEPASGDELTVSVAEARARFSELLGAAQAGGTVVITRRGEPVAELHAHRRTTGRIDWSWLHEATAKIPYGATDSGDLVREMRDDDRY